MSPQPPDEQSFRMGRGNWDAFDRTLDFILEATEPWAAALDGVDYPWLCWNVDHEWSIVQQRLVARSGWTPLVGFDPRVGPPPTIPEAIVVDFNAQLGFPVLYPHFVLEFAFAFTHRLAFWHSDLLLTEQDMTSFAETFRGIGDGAMAAVAPRMGLRGLLISHGRRYWELLGCTTRSASRSQFNLGCGWWMHFSRHPNFRDRRARNFHWEYGCGIHHWKRRFGGSVFEIKERDINYGHFTRIRNKTYVTSQKNNVFRNLSKDIRQNYSLQDCARSLNLAHLLPDEQAG